MAEGLRWMGVSEDQIAAAMRESNPDDGWFGIWDENWTTWMVFTQLDDQWQYFNTMRGAARRGGPPHTEIESTVRLMRIPRREWDVLFADLKDMVRAVLQVDQEQRTR